MGEATNGSAVALESPPTTREFICALNYDAPAECVVIGGQDFPKWILKYEKDGRTKRPLPPSRQQRTARLTDEQVAIVKAKLDEPVKVDARGHVTSGIAMWDPKASKHIAVKPFVIFKLVGESFDPNVGLLMKFLDEQAAKSMRLAKLAERMSSNEIGDPERKKISAEMQKLAEDLKKRPPTATD